MGFGREIEQLRKRANRAAVYTRIPGFKIYTLNEGDPEPENLDMWSIVIRIDEQRDYYGEAVRPTPPEEGAKDP